MNLIKYKYKYKFLIVIIIPILYIWLDLLISKNGLFNYIKNNQENHKIAKELKRMEENYQKLEAKLKLLQDEDEDLLDQLLKEKFNLCKLNEVEIDLKDNKNN